MAAHSQIGRRIKRTRELGGVVIPAVIHNGSYFFINLKVYEDGIVDCWEVIDLELLVDKIDSGWLVTSIPDGESISVSNFGSWTVESGTWNFDSKGFLEEIKSVVQQLNPKLENLYDFHGNNTKKVGNMNTYVLGSGNPKPFRADDSNAFDRGVSGENLSIFFKADDGQSYLADLRIFADNTIEIGRLPTPEVVSIDELSTMTKDGRLLTSPPRGTRIHIHGLGSFDLGEESYSTGIQDLLLEVQDCALRLSGKPDSVQQCRAAYDDYCENPTQAGVERLREAYEAIPEHNRRFVGDMDTKDIPVRMIIYGDSEIEGWTHRLVARSQGDENLPTITVPRPDGQDPED